MARYRKDELVYVQGLDPYVGRVLRLVDEEPETYDVTPPTSWIVRNRAAVIQRVASDALLPAPPDYFDRKQREL